MILKGEFIIMNFNNPADRQNLMERLRNLSLDSMGSWGKMSVNQMICHLSDQIRMAIGEVPAEPFGNLFHHTAFKWLVFYVLIPWPKGAKTVSEMDSESKGTRPTDFKKDRDALFELIQRFSDKGNDFKLPTHPLFGNLTRREWGRVIYLNFDHHLRQFGV